MWRYFDQLGILDSAAEILHDTNVAQIDIICIRFDNLLKNNIYIYI